MGDSTNRDINIITKDINMKIHDDEYTPIQDDIMNTSEIPSNLDEAISILPYKRIKNIKNLQLNLPKSNVPNLSSIPSPKPKIQNLSSKACHSSPSRSPSLFRPPSSGNISPSQKNIEDSKKKSTILAINIPSRRFLDIKYDAPLATAVENFPKPNYLRNYDNASPSNDTNHDDDNFLTVDKFKHQKQQLQPSHIKPQTITHSFEDINLRNNSESVSMSRFSNSCNTYNSAYPQGPVCVLEPNLYLYSEPTLDQLNNFDVIINVAQEIKNYSKQIKETNLKSSTKIEYYFIPWTHNSRLVSDFPRLTKLIETALNANKKVLIHCQCGVSRSASLILAYFMKVNKLGYNQAYQQLKEKAPLISPNLTLIYELMEWNQYIDSENGGIRDKLDGESTGL